MYHLQSVSMLSIQSGDLEGHFCITEINLSSAFLIVKSIFDKSKKKLSIFSSINYNFLLGILNEIPIK